MSAKKNQPANCEAFHASNADASKHVVGIAGLKVLITEDSGTWLAQGLDIDYFAEGASVESAQKSFAEGLKATIKEHLKIYGNIEKLLVVAPKDVWKQFYAEQNYHILDTISVHDTQPFNNVVFLQAA